MHDMVKPRRSITEFWRGNLCRLGTPDSPCQSRRSSPRTDPRHTFLYCGCGANRERGDPESSIYRGSRKGSKGRRSRSAHPKSPTCGSRTKSIEQRGNVVSEGTVTIEQKSRFWLKNVRGRLPGASGGPELQIR